MTAGLRTNFEDGLFIDAEHAQIRQADGGAAVRAGAQGVTEAEHQVGGGIQPFGRAGAGDFHPAFERQDDPGLIGAGGALRARLECQEKKEKQRIKNSPRSGSC